MLRQRIITALLIGLPLIGMVFWLPPVYVIAIFVVVVLMGGWEWSALARLQSSATRVGFLLMVALGMYLSWRFLSVGAALQNTLHVALLWWLLSLAWIVFRPTLMSRWAAVLAGLLVLVPAWLAIALLHLRMGPAWIFFLIIMVVSADIGGFLFGKRFGRTKLAPRVSPGKTWEGVVGGLVLSMLVALAGSQFFNMPFTSFMLLCLVTVAISVVGDLTESLFKRAAGLKDSGNLLPGHGGILDRIDSITAAAPMFLAGLIYLGTFKS